MLSNLERSHITTIDTPALTCMWDSVSTMHIQWQVPGQTPGQGSGLTTSVTVNWRPGPSYRHRWRLWGLNKEFNVSKEAKHFLSNGKILCHAGAYGMIFSAASLVCRSWERVKPTASTTARLCLCFWIHTHTHTTSKKVCSNCVECTLR